MNPAGANGDPLRLFYSYSHRDETLRDELAKHLSQLQRSGLITAWHDRKIDAGDAWEGKINLHLEEADIILLLISSDFLASHYCYDVEMRRALIRHAAGEALVVPIILRPVDWQETRFKSLQVLPKDARPVTKWPSLDDAFLDVAQSLRRLIEGRQEEATRERHRPVQSESQERIVDAAIPRSVQVGRTTDLVAMVRTEASGGLRAILSIEPDYSAAPEDVRSEPFTMEFPLADDGRPQPVPLALRLESTDFDPPVQEKRIQVPPDRDSETCVFLLTPTRAGDLRLLLDVRYGDLLAASRLLRTASTEEVRRAAAAGMPDYVLTSVPLVSAAPAATKDAVAPPEDPRAAVLQSYDVGAGGSVLESIPRPSASAPPDASSRQSRPMRRKSISWTGWGGGLAAVLILGLASVSYVNLGRTPPHPGPSATTALTIRADVAGVTVSVEGRPELKCVAPCALELPTGEPLELRFHKEGFADVRELIRPEPDRRTLEMEVRAPSPARPGLTVRRIPRVR